MEQQILRVLMVEDSADDAELTLDALRAGGFEVDCLRVETVEAMQSALDGKTWDVILSDYNLPCFSAGEALAVLNERGLDVPFIIVSGRIGEEAAVALMKAGAHDYVMKESTARLVPAVRRGVLETETRRQFDLAQTALQRSEARFRAIVSNVPGMVFQLARGPDGGYAFTYVSEGSHELLGLVPGLLEQNARLFCDLIVPEDRASLEHAIMESARQPAHANWEGRIKPLGSADVKWINIRTSTGKISGGALVWDGIMADITQRKRAEIEVVRSREQLAELSSYLQHVKEQERASIAREIHDDLGGTLTAVKIDLLWLQNRLPKRRPDLQGKVDALDIMVDRAIEATGRIASDLRPGILDCGIMAAIEWQAREFQSHTGIRCDIVTGSEEISLDPDLSITLFRIFQEALTNITKHAGASLVRVDVAEIDGWLKLEVRDNGRGMSGDDMLKPKSFGIRGMLERARNLGGKIDISGAPGQGTTLRVSLPRADASSHGAAERQFVLL